MVIQKKELSVITENVYLSGIGAITGENLKKEGITNILNTAFELDEYCYPDEVSVEVMHVLMRDEEKQDLLSNLDICVDHIHKVCSEGKNILVHCIAGVSRSPSVCIAYMMKYHNMSLRQAYQHVLERRHMIFPNFGFWRDLVTYEEKLRGANSVELMPFISGSAPSIFIEEVEYRIKLAWMPDLFILWTVQCLMLFLQMMFVIFRIGEM